MDVTELVRLAIWIEGLEADEAGDPLVTPRIHLFMFGALAKIGLDDEGRRTVVWPDPEEVESWDCRIDGDWRRTGRGDPDAVIGVGGAQIADGKGEASRSRFPSPDGVPMGTFVPDDEFNTLSSATDVIDGMGDSIRTAVLLSAATPARVEMARLLDVRPRPMDEDEVERFEKEHGVEIDGGLVAEVARRISAAVSGLAWASHLDLTHLLVEDLLLHEEVGGTGRGD